MHNVIRNAERLLLRPWRTEDAVRIMDFAPV